MNHLLGVILNLLPALVVFGVLIMVHELGHFIACRLSKVKVEKFSIGFGPELFHWQAGETRFSLSVLPLGGFVNPAGQEASKIGPEGPKPGDFLAASVGSRMFIIVSGVVMNYVLAFVLFAAVFMLGRPVPGAVVGSFVKDYPAATSGLQVGDKILKVNDVPVADWKGILEGFDKTVTPRIKLAIERKSADGAAKNLVISLTPKVEQTKDIFGKPFTMKRVGIMPDPKAFISEQYAFFPALAKAWELEVFHTVLTHKAIYYLVTGRLSPKNLTGPLGIIQISGQAAQAGLATLLQLMAILSVSLAVINLLPFPALDGGHLIFLLVEAVTRRKVSPVIQEKVATAGFVLLMVLMVFVFYNDFMNMPAFAKLRNFLHLKGG
ncbi:MAG TPA: RIP metalloprotease RseP [Candidatus Omnitrophota bacterium]|nr:RIP metalloprotease RseP [Candidatus Omnitrophota bacterium]HPS36740.1 RIP metalloprotease RseP [Candidatus Omnitrophota bacterium]